MSRTQFYCFQLLQNDSFSTIFLKSCTLASTSLLIGTKRRVVVYAWKYLYLGKITSSYGDNMYNMTKLNKGLHKNQK